MLEKVSWRSVTCPEVEKCNTYVFLPLPSCQLTDLPQDNHICSFVLLPFIPRSYFKQLKDTPFRLGMERLFQHLFLPSLLLPCLLSSLVSNSAVSPAPLPLWACRSVQLLSCWISSVYCVCSVIFLQKMYSFLIVIHSSLVASSNLEILLSYLVL